MELAKTYYCHTIKINPNNMRALYGLLLVCNYINFKNVYRNICYIILALLIMSDMLTFQTSTQLASSPKCTAQKKREYVKTVMWAAKQIAKTYESKLGPGKSKK